MHVFEKEGGSKRVRQVADISTVGLQVFVLDVMCCVVRIVGSASAPLRGVTAFFLKAFEHNTMKGSPGS